MANPWIKELQKLPGAADKEYDMFAIGLRTPSPSVNFVLGNTHLIPAGMAAIFWGPPKGGKSVLCNAIIGQLHKDDPNAIAVKYNTEMREMGQLTPRAMKFWGIDPDRYIGYDTNRPEEIFDKIENDIADMCERGAPIKLIIIDSITDVMGRKLLNSDSVSDFTMGDDAQTIQVGLRRIRSIIRKYKITLIMTAHERAEFDEKEKQKGRTVKMAGAKYLQHFAEYFIRIEPNDTVAGRSDVLGNRMENEELKDMMDKAERNAHKIRVTMTASSLGVANRTGEFTLDYHKGIINVHEEVFRIAVARKIVDRPNQVTYTVKDWPKPGETAEWRGKENFLINLKDNEDLQKELIKRLRLQDIKAYKDGVEADSTSTLESDEL